jgi:hypothetical protein
MRPFSWLRGGSAHFVGYYPIFQFGAELWPHEQVRELFG